MHAILAIAAKDLRLLVRDKTAFFFVFVFPLIIGILFGYIFSGGSSDGPSGVKVAIVDLDHTAASRAFASALASESALTITPVETQAAAEDMVRAGTMTASVVLPSGFESALLRIFEGDGAPIIVAIDPSRQMESGIIEGLVTAAGFRTLASAFTDTRQSLALIERSRHALDADTEAPTASRRLIEMLLYSAENVVRDRGKARAAAGDNAVVPGEAPASGFNPIRVDVQSVARQTSGPRSGFEITFPQASAWGIVGVVMGFGLSIVSERSSGTLSRLLMAPVSRWHVIAGKALGCFIGSLIVQVALFAIGIVFFHIRPDSYPLLALAIVCGCFGFVGVMMLLAVLGRTAAASQGIARAALLVLALVGGAGVPLFVMPRFMQLIAGASPFKWLILATEGALWRGSSLAEMAMPCGILVGVGVIGLILGALLFRDEA